MILLEQRYVTSYQLNIFFVHDIVLNDPKVKVREIAEIVSISTERVANILNTHLCMRKLCARWVPRLLTID